MLLRACIYVRERERNKRTQKKKQTQALLSARESFHPPFSGSTPRGVGAQAANLAHWGCSTPPDFPFVLHTEFWKEQSGADPSSSLLVWKE